MGQDSINQRNLLIIQNQFLWTQLHSRRRATKSRPTHFSLSINCNQIQGWKVVWNAENIFWKIVANSIWFWKNSSKAAKFYIWIFVQWASSGGQENQMLWNGGKQENPVVGKTLFFSCQILKIMEKNKKVLLLVEQFFTSWPVSRL